MNSTQDNKINAYSKITCLLQQVVARISPALFVESLYVAVT